MPRRFRCPATLLLCLLCGAHAAPGTLPTPLPTALPTLLPALGLLPRPGQHWTLNARTADGETFRTTLRLSAAPPADPGTFRADRGTLLLDAQAGTLIALDLQDARDGGLGLACAVRLNADRNSAPEVSGVLASGTLTELPARLEAALAVLNVTRTPQEQEEAARELGLGTCALSVQTP
ncbi:hypothetical protein [Deinococcus knuensis]|uniref:Uncharacterized protein n=1 Tax=Deinococcus knuensis TaxID=1837380 RepID=A0ABQ2SNI4_9DEIO|nr:hypothetical protein [Deinococcus knuensis]GGS32638.1 hypothetical protein GCM10008961_25360 [Deinococcus knuensis]